MGIFEIFFLIVLQIAFFAGLFFLLRVLFYNHLQNALRRLKEIQEEAMVKESQLREELERAHHECEAEVQKGRLEAAQLVEDAKREISRLRNDAEEAAYRERQRIIESGEKELERLRKKTMDQAQVRALELALDMINASFSVRGRSALHQELVRELMDEIEKLDESVFSVKGTRVKTVTTAECLPVDRLRLEALLREKMGRDIEVSFETDSTLLGGIVISIGEFVIDGSLKNRLQKVIPLLKN
jgi:F0F1-type ATP synthase membrane subunit b/b'